MADATTARAEAKSWCSRVGCWGWLEDAEAVATAALWLKPEIATRNLVARWAIIDAWRVEFGRDGRRHAAPVDPAVLAEVGIVSDDTRLDLVDEVLSTASWMSASWTPVEQEILELLTQGYNQVEIAALRGTTQSAVSWHVRRIRETARARRQGIQATPV